MKILLAAAMLSAVSFAAFAAEPLKPDQTPPSLSSENSADARAVASDGDVGQARRAYRASCGRYESAVFCECVTAGVAQALTPADLRIAARTIRERITAQGDAASSAKSDPPIGEGEGDAMTRIEQAEGHYVDSCAQFRS